MNQIEEVFKIKDLIKKIIKEHNQFWEDISINLRTYKAPKGYNCFTIKDNDILTIASGLVRKGIKINKKLRKK